MILNSQYKNSSSFPMDIKLNGKDAQLNKDFIAPSEINAQLYSPTGTPIQSDRNIVLSCANNMLFLTYNAFAISYSENGIYWQKASIPSITGIIYSKIFYARGKYFTVVYNSMEDYVILLYSSNGKTWSQKTTNVTNGDYLYFYIDEKVAMIMHGAGLFVSYDSDILNTSWKKISTIAPQVVVPYDDSSWLLASQNNLYWMSDSSGLSQIPLESKSRGTFVNLVGGINTNVFVMCFQKGYYIIEDASDKGTVKFISFGSSSSDNITDIGYLNNYFLLITDKQPLSVYYSRNISPSNWDGFSIPKSFYLYHCACSYDTFYGYRADDGNDNYLIKIPCGETITVTYK